MTSSSFDPAGVSSLVEALAQQVGAVASVSAANLALWLPELTVPKGWKTNGAEGKAVTRMLLRRVRSDEQWDACEVINLYRVAGVIPESLVVEHVDRTLRDAGAAAIQKQRLQIQAQRNVVAARAMGLLTLQDCGVHVQYTDYGINTPVGGALIEQTILVVGAAQNLLTTELAALTEDLEGALLSSLDRAPRPQHADGRVHTKSDTAGDMKSVDSSPIPLKNHRWARP